MTRKIIFGLASFVVLGLIACSSIWFSTASAQAKMRDLEQILNRQQ